MQIDQIRYGNTYGEGRVVRSGTPLHLYKYVARLTASAEFLVTLRAKLSVLLSVLSVGLYVCGSVTTITRNCVHRSSPNWVCS